MKNTNRKLDALDSFAVGLEGDAGDDRSSFPPQNVLQAREGHGNQDD
jgi:hypothetical protein